MEKETGRIEAFSDGIFAVAITLLALDIGVGIKDVGQPTDQALMGGLLHLWPRYLAYANSFAAVLLMWMAHHRLFRLVRAASNRIMLANGLLLLIVALVPFPTKTMGEFIDTAAQRSAAIFYTGYSILVCCSFLVLAVAAMGADGRYLLPGCLPKARAIKKGLVIGVGCYLAITVVACIAPMAGIVLSTAMWVYWAVSNKETQEA